MKKFFFLALTLILSFAGTEVQAGSVDSQGMPIFYLRGNFNNTSWSAQNNYKFTRSGNDYSLTINRNNAIGECEFKIADDNWDIFNLGANVTIDESQYVDGILDGVNMKTSGMNNAVISFTYNPGETKAKIKFVLNGVDPDDNDNDDTMPVVYLRGDFNNTGWSPNNKYKFNHDGNVYTLQITPSNPITAGSAFKIGSEDWQSVDLGGFEDNIYIDNTQTLSLLRGGINLHTEKGITNGYIKFVYNPEDTYTTSVYFYVEGSDELPVQGISGTLPVLYINVYTDENHTLYNNEVISKDLNHKNYFEFAEYWLDVNGCKWLEELGAENVGSAEKPLALQIKARGNWTRIGFSKKPFKLKLDKKQSLLGMSKSKHYAILAHADDQKGYLRNFVGFNLGKRIGLPWTPSQQPVEVVINGDYRGVYFLTESIRIDEDRVNITELNDNESDSKLVSGGYIVELDNYEEDASSQIVMEEKACVSNQHLDPLRITFDTPEIYSDLQRWFINQQFSTMNDLVGANSNDLWKYLDLDDAARYYIVEEIVSHTESYHGSTYLFRDYGDGQKWHFSPLWDFGNAFNGHTDNFFYNCDPFGNTWIPSMRENAKFNSKVKETWLWFMSNCYKGLEQDIEEYVNHLTDAAKADYKRWNGASIPKGGQPVADNRDMQGRKSEVLNHLNSKISWLKNQFGDYTVGNYAEPLRDTTEAAELPIQVSTGLVNVIAVGDIDSEAVYFNLQGMKVNNPEPGKIYIICKNGKATKAIIK